MPNRVPAPDAAHVPSHSCIRLEAMGENRTSSIDAGWDSLSLSHVREADIQTVSARPHFETLPGLGPYSLPTHTPTDAPKQRRAQRSPLLVSALATTFAVGLAVLLTWLTSPGLDARPSLTASVQSNLVAATSQPGSHSQPSVKPNSNSAEVEASAHVMAPESVPAQTPKIEVPPDNRELESKPIPRAILLTAPRAAANSRRATRALTTTDNPY